LARREAGELIDERRLWSDLLSSQPMCFNLLGELAADLELATHAARSWWPGRVDQVTAVQFEWSPGRRDLRYLGNRTAFDAVLMHTTPAGGRGFIGIETKYHENAERPRPVPLERLRRPVEITERSGAFHADWHPALTQTSLRQIWLDHLLALSMLDGWDTGLFMLVHPAANISMADAADRYAEVLSDSRTFEHRTLEDLVARLRTVTDAAWVEAFADRYLDFDKLRSLGIDPPGTAARPPLEVGHGS
jgi:hypothetical protein